VEWTEALDLVESRTGVARYRELCDEANPDRLLRDAWRARMVEMATDRPAAYPSLLRQAANLATSAYNHVAGGLQVVDRAEYDRRRAICGGCDRLDRERDRCTACGCMLAVKPWGAREACPLGRWAGLGGPLPNDREAGSYDSRGEPARKMVAPTCQGTGADGAV
jgi:hypothetical protein